MRNWQLQDAKARLSEVVRAAEAEGPQTITVRGETTAVVVSAEEFDRLAGRHAGLVEFLRSSPLRGAGVLIERDKSPTRDVEIA